MNNRTLAIIFFALLAVYLLNRLFSGRQESTFRSDLVQLDTALVDKIELYPKAGNGPTVTLERRDGGWTVSNGTIQAPAVGGTVQSLLGQLTMLKAKRVVARQEEKWKDYEVEAGSGNRVKAYDEGQVLADFIVGRFSFNQQTRQATSYVRLADEPAVYAVDGFLSMAFGQDMNAFRNKQILALEAEAEVDQIQLQAGATTTALQKMDGQWLIDGRQPVDSTKVAGYLNGLRYVAGNTFADGFTPAGAPERSLLIQAGGAPITISAYRYSGGEQDFVIQSSQFPDALFASDSSGIYNRLFVALEELTRQ